MTGQCVAAVHVKGRGSHRCAFRAKHAHVVNGVTLKVCGNHLRALKHRERLGTEPDLIKGWDLA